MITFARLYRPIRLVLAILLVSSAAAHAAPIKIVAFGDSLTAGYQLPAADAFPAQLQAALRAAGHDVEIRNAGVSGDTSTGGLARLDWSIADDVQAVILELGANDALRAIDPAVTRKTLDTMIERLVARDIKVLIAGMRAPPNLGPAYAADFNPIFADLAKKHDVLLYPFFLDGVAAEPALNLSDGMHPNPQGVAIIVKNILPMVERLIAQVGDK